MCAGSSGWSGPIVEGKFVGSVIGKEGFDPSRPQVRGPVRSRCRADGRVRQFETFLSPIVPIPALKIANDQSPTRSMVGEVRKGSHDPHIPVVVDITNPSIVGGELLEISDFRFHHVRNVAVGIMNRSPIDRDFETYITYFIPLLGVINCLINDLKILFKIQIAQIPILRLEPLANGSLFVAVSTDVGSLQYFSKLSLPDFSGPNSNIV